jgi:hypothetical protein
MITTPRHTGSARAAEQTAKQDQYLSAPAVRRRFGVSDMWLHRRLYDGSGFPAPDLIVKGRRFWKLSTLEAWERRAAAQSPR